MIAKSASTLPMLTTGNQVKAARAMAGMDQVTLARKAGVNVNTIKAMEARGDQPLISHFTTIRKVMAALEKAGIEFLNGGRPGVRMR